MDFRHSTHLRLRPGQVVATPGEILAYAAMHFPDKIGIVCRERRWTFAELDRLANRFAHAVSGRFGERPGPIGILGKNSAEYLIAHFGASRTGRFTVNLPVRSTEDDLAYTVNITRPAVIVVDTDCASLVEAAAPRFDRVPDYVSIGAYGPGITDGFWEFVANGAETAPAIAIDPDAPGAVIFTGGTTGKPKAVVSSHRARAVSAMAAVEDFRITEDVVAGYAVPFTHTAGIFSWLQPAMLAGCTGAVIAKWDPAQLMDLTERHGISVIFAVPAQIELLLAHAAFDAARLASLSRIIVGGAPLTRSLIERTEAAMPWLACERAYGSTETGHLAAQVRADRDVVYDGFNQPGGRLEIAIFKAPGIVAAVGETGELATRGPHLMSGYLDDAEAEAAYFKSGDTDGKWGWTGDLAVRQDGYFRLLGRSKHMILSGGLNIYPAELEGVLALHADVAECAVFGIDDPVWGEVPAAAVVARTGAIDPDAILHYVAARVARHKRLRRVFIVDEIPRTAAGKPLIHEVKSRCLA